MIVIYRTKLSYYEEKQELFCYFLHKNKDAFLTIMIIYMCIYH